jgi:SAM-dependent methyltransferase
MCESWTAPRTRCARRSATATDPAGFDRELFAYLAAVEPRSFWFRARNRLIVSTIARHFPAARSILELGSGTGFVLAALREAFPNVELGGSELFPEGLEIARDRVPDAKLFAMDLTAPEVTRGWDVVGAFDVLEHIDDDEATLASMRELTQAGGGIVVLVPQHPRLWSAADDFAHHRRRYTRKELVQKVEGAGFDVVRVTSWVVSLLPALVASRLFRRRKDGSHDLAAELVPPFGLNALFERLLDAERVLIARGARFPVGASLLLVARR